jgi:hypothetical protein
LNLNLTIVSLFGMPNLQKEREILGRAMDCFSIMRFKKKILYELNWPSKAKEVLLEYEFVGFHVNLLLVVTFFPYHIEL